MTQKFWQPARRELVYLALAGMEVCVLVPAVLAAGQSVIDLPRERAVPAFFVVILLAFNLVRLLEALDLKSHIQRDIGLAILVFWIGIALRFTLYRHYPWYSLRWVGEMFSHLGEHRAWLQDAVLVVMVLLFWWRGLALAGRPISVEAVGYHFRAGVLLMAITVTLAARLVRWSSIPFVLGYFFLGLVAVALTRAEEVGRWRTGLPFPFSAGWLLAIATAAGAAILIAIGLISLFTGENLVQVLSRLGPIWQIVSFIIAGVLTLVVILLTPLITAVANWLVQAAQNAGVEVPNLSLEPAGEVEPGEASNLPMIDWSPYEPILRGLLIAFAILVVALAFGQLWRARSQLGAVSTETVRGRRALGTGLADRARKGLQSLVGQIGFLNRWYTAASIRRIYAQMVATAGRRGYPRADSETPFEYLTTLTGAWPDLSSQLGAITHAYVRVHYGELPETEEELEAIRTAWREIQSPG
jgi:hypothetical protein